MTDKETKKVKIKANYWSHEDTSDHKCIFHLSGLTEKEETVQIKIEGFTPYLYLELPSRIKWTDQRCKGIIRYFRESMGEAGPIKYRKYEKDKLHYKKKTNTMMISFPTGQACRDFANKCHDRRGFYIPNVGRICQGDFNVHEHNIDPLIKYTGSMNIPLAGWLEIEKKSDESDDEDSEEIKNFSTADIDFCCNWKDVKSCKDQSPNVILHQKYCSFDGEMYSVNHNSKLPDFKNKKNKVFQISMIFGRIGCKEKKKMLLSLFDPLDIENVEVVRCKSEKDLLLKFSSIIRDEDPDIFITYNGMKFDWNYMIKRAELLGILPIFLKLSRIKREKAEVKKSNWSSSAYGQQDFSYPECRGRVNIDVLLEIERNYKLPKYSLNSVANEFLKREKVDVSPRQIFMLYKLTEEILPLVKDKKLSMRDLRVIKRKIAEILPFRLTHGDVRKYRKKLIEAKADEMENLIREAITIVGIYCVEDSNLPIDLVEHKNLTTTMEQMSNVMHVPTSYLHTRGQQIRVLAQVYREAISNGNNYIIPFVKKDVNKKKEKYQGAVVIEANPGDYYNVGCLDFASLYPTTMIAFNICYTTILEDDDPTPDSECHVLEWEDHVGCIRANTPISVSRDHSLLIKDMVEYHKQNGKVQALNKDGTGTKSYLQTNFFPQGVRKCVKLTLEDGTTLECTPDHKIRCSNGEWMEAQNLMIGKTRISSGYNPPIFDMEKEKMNIGEKEFSGEKLYIFLKLLGLLCSDGGIYDKHVTLSSGHKIDVENIISDVKYLTEKRPRITKENYGYSIHITGWLNKLFRDMSGILKGNKQTQLRTFPDFLENAPENVTRAFLSGLFGGDGHTFTYSDKAKSMGSLALSWSSEKIEYLIPIFEKLQIYLKRCGIESSVFQYGKERKLTIPVSDSIKFKEKIGFAYCCHKSMRLEAVCHYLRLRDNVWKQQKRIVENVKIMRDELNSQKKKIKLKDLVEKAVGREDFFYNNYYGNPSPSQMNDLLRDRKDWSKPMFSKEHFPGPLEYMEQIGARELFSKNGEIVYGVNKESSSLPLFNLKVIHIEDIGEHEVFDLEIDKSHSFLANGIVVHNCSHDPQKRKKKKEDVLCGKYRYRFRKVVIDYDEKTGEVTRKNEGLMPHLERNLLFSRKIVKKELFKTEARLKMQRGTCTPEEVELYRKCGFEIIEKGLLGKNEEIMLEVTVGTLNAKQLAIKTSANSAYGTMGAATGFIPFIPGAASVTAMGRKLITMAIEKIRSTWNNCRLVYGDTDSCMIRFEGANTEESFELCRSASRLATHYLKCWILGLDENYCVVTKDGKKYTLNKIDSKGDDFKDLSHEDKVHVVSYESIPIDLEFENMYGRLLLLTKKRYVAFVINSLGNQIAVVKKGVVLVRRNNCDFLRSVYRKMSDSILNDKSEEEVMNILYDEIQRLFTRGVPDSNLIIYTSVKNVMSYAKKEEKKNRDGRVIGEYYIDDQGDPIEDPVGPLDPRLVYPNLPQCILALKMMRRGTDVPSNTRLEYIYFKNPHANHEGERIEDYTYYNENKYENKFFPDFVHYLDKQLMKSVTELISVKFKKENIIYEKLDDALSRLLYNNDLSELKKNRIAKTNKFVKTSSFYESDDFIGWEAIKEDSKPYSRELWEIWIDGKITRNVSDREYISKGKIAKVNFIIESSISGGVNDFTSDKMDEEAELINICKKWKARYILDKFYRFYGMKKRPCKKPTQSGKNLRKGTKVCLVENVDKKYKGAYSVIIDSHQKGEGKNKEYDFDLLFEDEVIINNVPRKSITTFYKKDGKILKDILGYRKNYQDVVENLKKIFLCKISFIG